jgi:hypothetical protein
MGCDHLRERIRDLFVGGSFAGNDCGTLRARKGAPARLMSG